MICRVRAPNLRFGKSAGLCLVCMTLFAHAALSALELPEIDEIDWFLAQQQPPKGIIFEIREYDEDALEWVGPRLERYVEMLRARFPRLPIAVLSHGDEMLALQEANRNRFKRSHNIARRLAVEFDVSFHVCGSFAEYNGLSAEDFPEYVDVVPHGPSQIVDYREFGYELISLELTW